MASRQQSLRWDTIKPQIVVGKDYYPMRPTPLMTNRWEGWVPVPAGANLIHYRYKFDFNYNTLGRPGADRLHVARIYAEGPISAWKRSAELRFGARSTDNSRAETEFGAPSPERLRVLLSARTFQSVADNPAGHRPWSSGQRTCGASSGKPRDPPLPEV